MGMGRDRTGQTDRQGRDWAIRMFKLPEDGGIGWHGPKLRQGRSKQTGQAERKPKESFWQRAAIRYLYQRRQRLAVGPIFGVRLGHLE
jgi:hypothetical protein